MASTYSLITDLCRHLSDIDGYSSLGQDCSIKSKINLNRIKSIAFETLLKTSSTSSHFTLRNLEEYGLLGYDSSLFCNKIADRIYYREKSKGAWSKEKKNIIDELLKKAETMVQNNPSFMSVFELLLCLADTGPGDSSRLKHHGIDLHPNRTEYNQVQQCGFKPLNCLTKFNHEIFDFDCCDQIIIDNTSIVEMCNLSPGMGLKHAAFFTKQTFDNQLLRSNVPSINEFDVTNSNWILPSLQSPRVIENSASTRRGILQDEGYVTPDQDVKSFQQTDLNYIPWEDMNSCDVKLVFSWESYGDYKTKNELPFLSQSSEAMQHIWNIAMPTEVATSKPRTKIPPLREIDLNQLKIALSYLLVGEEFNGIFYFNEDEQSFHLQDGLHFSGSSMKLLKEYCEEFIECSNAFYELSKVIERSANSRFSNSNGIVYQALCNSIERYLRLYRGVVQHMPGDRLRLLAWVQTLCPQLQFLCDLCRPDEDLRIRGGALLARLYEQVPMVVQPSIASLLYGILQSCCRVYFIFLEKWVFEGNFEDVHKEFFIECCNLSEISYDRKFWTRGFFLNRMLVPGFLKGLENDIFSCGKTLALLRLCAADEPVCQRGYPGITCCMNKSHLEEVEEKCRLYKERCNSSCSQKFKLVDSEPTKNEEYYAAIRAKSMEKIMQAHKGKEIIKAEKKREEFEMLRKNMEEAETRKLLEKRILLEEEVKLLEEAEKEDELNQLRREEKREKIMQYYTTLSIAADSRKERAEWKIKRANLHDKRVKFFKDLKTIESSLDSTNDKEVSNIKVNPDSSDETANTLKSDVSVSTSNSVICTDSPMSHNIDQTDLNQMNYDLISEQREWNLALEAAEQVRQDAAKIKERNMFNDYNILTGEVASYQTRFCSEKMPDGGGIKIVDLVDAGEKNPIPPPQETNSVKTRELVESQREIKIVDVVNPGEKNQIHPPQTNSVGIGELGESHVKFQQETFSVEPVVLKGLLDTDQVDTLTEPTVESKHEVSQAFTKLNELNIHEIDMTTINYNLKMSVMIPLITQLELANEAALRLFLVTHSLQKHFECIRKYFFLLDGEFSSVLSNNLFISIQTGKDPSSVLNVSNLNSLLRSAVRPDDEFSERLSFYINEIPSEFKFIDPNMLDCLSMRYRTHWPLNVIITEEAIVKYDKVFKFLIKLQRTSWALEQVICLLRECRFLDSEQLRQIHLYRHIMTHFIHSLKNYVMTVLFEESWFNFSKEMQQVSTLNDIHSAHVKYVKTLLFKCLLNKRSLKMQNCVEELFGTILLFHQVLRKGDQPKTFVNLCNQFDNFLKLARYLYKYIDHFVNTGYQPHLVQLLSVLSANEFYSKE